MRIEIQPTSRAVSGPNPALDHNRLAATVNTLQQQIGSAALETLVSKYDVTSTTGWTASSGSVIASGGVLNFAQSGTSLVSLSVTQATTSGMTYGVRMMVKGDVSSSGKFVQVGITNGSGYTQLSVPVMLSLSYQEIMAIVPVTATSSTLSISGFDTVSGNNIFVNSVEVVSIQTPTVRTSGRSVLKNGNPKRWRGMNHSNIPIGYDYNHYFWQEPKQSRYDLQDIAAAGFDCIKIYDDSYNRQGYGAFLDECYRNGIDVFFFHYTTQQTDYTVASGSANRTAQTNMYTTMVTNVMYHPAVVGYGLGNEMNFALGPTTQLSDWYSLLDSATVAAKAIDATRVYTTSNGDVGTLQLYDSAVPHLDMWGATVYRGTGFGTLGAELATYTQRPVLISEYGYDRYNHAMAVPGEDEAGQAIRDLSLTKELDGINAICARFTFEWADEWWKEQMTGNSLTTHDHQGSQNYNDDRDQTYDEEWFGMTEALNTGSAQPRVKKMAYTQIKQYQLGTPVVATQSIQAVQNALASPGGFLMRDTYYVNYQVQITPRGLLQITPIYVIPPENYTTPIFQLNDTSYHISTAGGTNLVDTWTDISAYRTIAYQYNLSNMPTYIAAALNGHGIFRFGGSGQFMEINNIVLGNNVTVFIVAANQRATLGTGIDTLISTVPSGGTVGGVAMNTYSQYGLTPTQRTLGADFDGSATPPTVLVNGSTNLNLAQGVFKVLTYQANVTAHNYMRIALYTDGVLNGMNDIAEIIIYQGILPSASRQSVESSLITKYAIT